MHGVESTSMDTNPALQQLESPAAQHSFGWRLMAEKFLKGKPKLLGTMQILIALMNFGLGRVTMSIIMSIFNAHPIFYGLGYPIWGSVMFIISGSLSIAAGIRTSKGLIQSSIGLNITSSVVAAVGFIIMAISMNVLAFYYPFLNHNQTVYTLPMCFSIAEGLKSMVLILSLLELSIAVALSTFGCKVACGFPGGVVLILPSNPPVA